MSRDEESWATKLTNTARRTTILSFLEKRIRAVFVAIRAASSFDVAQDAPSEVEGRGPALRSAVN
jgi:hypothetical protein